MQGMLAIIHTTPVTIEPLKRLAEELLPGCRVMNVMDDSILPELAANGGDVGAVRERLCKYAEFAERQGARVILSACSSVGELVDDMRRSVTAPVVRIDEPMAERAVRAGERIGVAATAATTVAPTLSLLKRKAAEAGRDVAIEPMVAEDAYRLLLAGDREGHDASLGAALLTLAGRCDVVVLAQASMARVVEALPEAARDRFLSSPRLGMELARERLREASADAATDVSNAYPAE